MLIKPVRSFEESLQRRLRQREPTRREVVAGEVEAAFDTPMKVLSGCLVIFLRLPVT